MFFIQKPPLVVSGKTKSIPSFGAFVRLMSPVARCDGVRAISGRNGIPSRRSPTVDPPDAPTAPAQGEGADECEDDDAGRRQSHAPESRGCCSGAETKTSSEVRSGDDGDADPLNRVVHVATEVPHRVERLLVPRGVAGAAAELVLPRSGVPPESPRTPGPPTERGRRPTRASAQRAPAVDRHVNGCDVGFARPCAPLDDAPPAWTKRSREPKSGIPGGIISARTRIRDELTGLILFGPQPVRLSLLIPVERSVQDREPRESLHAGHAVPPRHDQPEGKPCCGARTSLFIAYARTTSSRAPPRSAGCARLPLASTPRSSPVKMTSTAPSSTTASARTDATETLCHRAVPTASMTQGWLTTCGFRPARARFPRIHRRHDLDSGATEDRRGRGTAVARRVRPPETPPARVDGRDVVVGEEVVEPDGVTSQRNASAGMPWPRAAS